MRTLRARFIVTAITTFAMLLPSFAPAAHSLIEAASKTNENSGLKSGYQPPKFSRAPRARQLPGTPGRNLETRGWWTGQMQSDLQNARYQRVLEARPLALLPTAIAAPILSSTWGTYTHTGVPLPGEGSYDGGGSGSRGADGGLVATVNTNTGNLLSVLPITAWSSHGQSGIDLTLYHNSSSGTISEFGMQWTHTYSSRVTPVTGGLVLETADGLAVPYTLSGGNYLPPDGWFHKLETITGGYKLTTTDQFVHLFNSSGLLTSITDRVGNAVTISRLGGGEVDEVTGPDGRKLEFNYTSSVLTSITGPGSRDWLFSISFALDEVEYPLLNGNRYSRTFDYDAAGTSSGMQLIGKETDPMGNEWTWDYDGSFLVERWDAPSTLPTNERNYRTFDYLTGRTDIGAETGTLKHHYSSGLLQSVEDRESYSDLRFYTDRLLDYYEDNNWYFQVFWYDVSGNLIGHVDKVGEYWEYDYNATNDIESLETPEGNITEFEYVASGNGQGLLYRVKNGLNDYTKTLTYDSDGNVLTSTDAEGRVTNFDTNSNGDVIEVDPPGAVLETTYTYNSYGQVLTVTDPSSNVTTTTYDNWLRPVNITYPASSPQPEVNIIYDLNGNTLDVENELGKSTAYTYDDANRVRTKTNAVGDTEHYGYNEMDWLIWVRNGEAQNHSNVDWPDYTREYMYTNRGEVSWLMMPDGAHEVWTYDPAGNITEYSNQESTIEYTYNTDLLIGINYPSGTPDVTFDYDTDSRRVEMVDGAGTTTWTYNAADAITALTTPQGNHNYVYNNALQRTQLIESSLSSPNTTNYTYSATTGLLEEIENRFSEETTFEYDDHGRIEKKVFDPGHYELNTYDSRGRLDSITLKTSGHSVMDAQSYVYDKANFVKEHTVGSNTTEYTYDDAGQLIREEKPWLTYDKEYEYDGNGNRTKTFENGSSERRYVYDPGDRLMEIQAYSHGNWTAQRTFTYDTAGRMATDSFGTRSFTWDHESRLTSLTHSAVTSTHAYNGLNTRVSRTVSPTTTTYTRDGTSVTAPLLRDTSGISYTPQVSHRTGSTTTFQHFGLKNTEWETSTTPAILATTDYDAFGNEASVFSIGSPMGYGGGFGYQSDPSGLNLLGHRWMDPTIGRFITKDPVHDGRNWYVYCANNPVSGSDPSGTITWLIVGVAVIAVAWAGWEVYHGNSPANAAADASTGVAGALAPPGTGELGGAAQTAPGLTAIAHAERVRNRVKWDLIEDTNQGDPSANDPGPMDNYDQEENDTSGSYDVKQGIKRWSEKY